MQTDMSSSFRSDKSATSTNPSLKKAGEGRIVSLHDGPADLRLALTEEEVQDLVADSQKDYSLLRTQSGMI